MYLYQLWELAIATNGNIVGDYYYCGARMVSVETVGYRMTNPYPATVSYNVMTDQGGACLGPMTYIEKTCKA